MSRIGVFIAAQAVLSLVIVGLPQAAAAHADPGIDTPEPNPGWHEVDPRVAAQENTEMSICRAIAANGISDSSMSQLLNVILSWNMLGPASTEDQQTKQAGDLVRHSVKDYCPQYWEPLENWARKDSGR